MSQYNIENLTIEKYVKDYEEVMLYNFDKFYVHKHFRIGEGICSDKELKHAFILHRTLSKDSCEVLEYVKDKIAGKLEKSVKTKKNKELLDSLRALSAETEEVTYVDTRNYWSNVYW